MSVQATTWVWANSKAQDNTLLVALAIADAANAQGSESCQSVKTLGKMARCSESTVHRALRWLIDEGEVECIGQNPRYSNANIYRFKALWNPAWGGVNLTGGAAGDTGGVSSTPEGGVVGGTQPHKDTPEEHPTSSSAGADGNGLMTAKFNTWWELYPRKVAKKEAVKAYEKAAKEVGHEVLLEGLMAHLPGWKGQAQKLIPHPATWLNGGRWEDRPDAPTEQADSGEGEDPTAWMKRRG